MVAEEIRRTNINLWAEKLGRAKLAEIMGCENTVYLNLLCGGHGSFGAKAARKIEVALGLERGWFDRVHDNEHLNSTEQSATDDNMSRLTRKRYLTPLESAECFAAKAIFDRNKKRLGLSQEILASKIGVTQPAIHAYLNGVNAINFGFALSFAAALDSKVSDFSPRLADIIIRAATKEAEIEQCFGHVHNGGGSDASLIDNPIKSGIGDRIKSLRNELGLTQESLASKLGCSAVTIGYWENDRHVPAGFRLVGLAKALKTSPGFIVNGCNIKAPDEHLPHTSGSDERYREHLVPLLSWSRADKLSADTDAEVWIPCPGAHSLATYALRVVGDSMTSLMAHEHRYPPGTIIFVDPERAPITGSRVIAKTPNSNDATFKVLDTDGGMRYLRPINPQYPAIQIQNDTIICGVVIGSYWPE